LGDRSLRLRHNTLVLVEPELCGEGALVQGEIEVLARVTNFLAASSLKRGHLIAAGEEGSLVDILVAARVEVHFVMARVGVVARHAAQVVVLDQHR